MLKKIKNQLKKVLPTPVYSFNKEIDRLQTNLSEQIEHLEQLICNIDCRINQLEEKMLRTMPRPRIPYFALNIVDHCNLGCKGCDHFAPIAQERFVSFENIQRDLERMSYLTGGNVTRISIMGGEPLLHPHLKEIIVETRKHFPSTLIRLVTNGILLLKKEESFWEACRENDIVIVNTRYPLNLNYDRMQETAASYGVKFEFYEAAGEVRKTSYKMPLDITGSQDPCISFTNCFHVNRMCLLMEGKFYACTVLPNVRHFNKRFGTDMQPEDGDYLDIYNVQSVQEILNFMCTPKPFCRFCDTTHRTFGHPWERSKKEMNEWLL